MKVGITPPDAQFHYVNIKEIESHEKAIEVKKELEMFCKEKGWRLRTQ